jgi:adenine deaminase
MNLGMISESLDDVLKFLEGSGCGDLGEECIRQFVFLRLAKIRNNAAHLEEDLAGARAGEAANLLALRKLQALHKKNVCAMGRLLDEKRGFQAQQPHETNGALKKKNRPKRKLRVVK